MRLLNVKINDDYNYDPFVDEFDRFDEFDIEVITKDYDYKRELKNNIKNIDEVK
jgi:hypothetical protein